MNDLTLIIPAKNESESLPQVIDSLKNLDCKIKVSLKIDDKATIDSIGNFNTDTKTVTKIRPETAKKNDPQTRELAIH